MKKTMALVLVLITLVTAFGLPVAASAYPSSTYRVPVYECFACGGTMRFCYHHEATLVPGDFESYDMYQCTRCGRTEKINVIAG